LKPDRQQRRKTMADQDRESRRSRVGYGSTYRRVDEAGSSKKGLTTVLGGRKWLVKPDQKAKPEHPCLWMQAGAVKFKSCTNFYDCTACAYDHAMGEKAQAGKQISWQGAMRLRPEMHRLCRHSLTGRMEKRACAYNYECATCDFDQFFEDVWAAKTSSSPADVRRIKGFDVPSDHFFHDGHTWARIESGGAIRIGMDDFALKVLGRADAFELPLMGHELNPGKPSWGLKRRDNTANVLAPVGGVILDVNQNVRETPAIANGQPYGNGWLFLIRTPDVKASVKPLMTDQGTMGWMQNEVEQLEHMIEEVAGPLAADGGFLADDIYGNLPVLDWTRLTKTFLRT
jgi:glycine cleavage system H lipoate-binding protein